MPEDITNLVTYINSMSITLYDKCWWIDKVPDFIDTVVDFGCAGGDLAFMIERIMPNRFLYVGVDNSPIMLDMAKHNFDLAGKKILLFNNLKTAVSRVDRSSSILILNSVIHEIYSYLDADECDELFNLIFHSGFRYIAIRDMHKFHQNFNWAADRLINDYIAKIQSHPKYGLKWAQFMQNYEAENNCCALNEFILKYRYDANWARESKEIYLWPWIDLIYRYGTEYCINFENDFYIPFIKDKIKEDFGFIYPQNTHKKLLLKMR